MTPFELFFALRFSPSIDAVYIDTRDSVKVYLTYRDGRTYFYETDRSNGRRWRTLTCHEARDGRWPQLAYPRRRETRRLGRGVGDLPGRAGRKRYHTALR